MVEYTSGDILKADVDAIVNTVNCVGVMGRGIALQFKKAWPDNFKSYAAACKTKSVMPGQMFVFETHQTINPKFIINFPTKRHWRGASRMEDIESGLVALVMTIKEKNIRSIALPPLGCGLGGLNWHDVREKIEKTMAELPDNIQVFVYQPTGAPANEKMVRNRKVPSITSGRAVLVELIKRYLNGLLDPFVTLLEVHKLLYFMQEAGEPLSLKFAKAPYGPYAENLRHVLNELEGHMVSGYADGGDRPDKPISLVPGAAEDAEKFLQSHPESVKRFERVSELVEGFESPYGLELLSTIHWVAKHDAARTSEEIRAKTYEWNERKQQFSQRQIEMAIQTLKNKGWINDANL